MSNTRQTLLLTFWAFVVLPWLSCSRLAAAPDEKFAQASTAYEAEKFEEALSLYQELADGDGMLSPESLFNTGNAAYRLGRDGESVLWYRRASALDPSFTESRQNLRFLKRKLGFVEFEPNTLERFAHSLRGSSWRNLLALAAWGAAFCLVWLIFFPAARSGRLWPSLAFCLMLVLVGVCIAGVLGKGSATGRPTAKLVVTEPEVSAFVAPTGSASAVLSLPPGSEIILLEQRDAWIYCAIPGDLRGWVKSEATKKLWPYSPGLLR